MEHSLLLVHAHPDDEALETGATMAKYVAEGAHVTLVTCTLGEEGEIVVPALAHLAADREDRLGEHRIGELAAACAALGVHDHRFLGGPGRYRDSGMMDTPANQRPNCFWQADLDEAARLLVEVIREVRPQVVVTYDENGFYGHPDHIQAHRVAWRAYERAADQSYVSADRGEPWQPAKFYATAVPRTALAKLLDEMRAAGHEQPFGVVDSVDDLPFGVPDAQVTTEVDCVAHLDAKMAAMRAHHSQISVSDPFFALSDNVARRAFGREYYTLLAGERGHVGGPNGRESDLFAGIP